MPKFQPSGLLSKLPWEGGADIGLAVWQEVNTKCLYNRGNPTTCLLSLCLSFRAVQTPICMWTVPATAGRRAITNLQSLLASSLSEKRKSRWSDFGQGQRVALSEKRAIREVLTLSGIVIDHPDTFFWALESQIQSRA